MIEIILGALAEAVFSVLVEDLAQRPGLETLRAKLKGSPEKFSFQHALTVAYISFSREYSSLSASFFDNHFLQKAAIINELAKLLTPNKVPDKTIILKLWKDQFANPPTIDLSEPLSSFLENLSEEIKTQPLLRPFIDSRALNQLYAIAERNLEQIAIQEQIRDLLTDIRDLLEGVKDPNISKRQLSGSDDLSKKHFGFQDELVDLLLKVPAFMNRTNRDTLMWGLDEFSITIERSNVPLADLISIIRSIGAVGRLTSGEWPLAILMRNAQRYCPPNTELSNKMEILLSNYHDE